MAETVEPEKDGLKAYKDAILGKGPPGPWAAAIEAATKGHYVLDIPNEIPDLDDWPDGPTPTPKAGP